MTVLATRVLASVAVALGVLALRPAPAHAQVTDSSAAHADGPIPLAGDTSLMRPRRLLYALTRTTDTATVQIGERLVELGEAEYGALPAWSLVERLSGPHLPAGEDSLLLRRGDLSPLRWQSVLGHARLAAEFARDTMYAALQAPSIRRSVTAAMPPSVVPTAGALERWLEIVPLTEGWFADVPLLVMDLGGPRLMDATLEVEGGATVETALGVWEAWRVVLRAGSDEKRFWVRKVDPVVLRTHQLIPGSGGQALEAILIGEELATPVVPEVAVPTVPAVPAVPAVGEPRQ